MTNALGITPAELRLRVALARDAAIAALMSEIDLTYSEAELALRSTAPARGFDHLERVLNLAA